MEDLNTFTSPLGCRVSAVPCGRVANWAWGPDSEPKSEIDSRLRSSGPCRLSLWTVDCVARLWSALRDRRPRQWTRSPSGPENSKILGAAWCFWPIRVFRNSGCNVHSATPRISADSLLPCETDAGKNNDPTTFPGTSPKSGRDSWGLGCSFTRFSPGARSCSLLAFAR